MSRILALMFFLALTLVAPNSAQAKMKVFACFPEWEALVKQLGGDKVEIFTAIGPLRNPDHVDVTPATIAALASADLLVCTGADFEGEWLPGALGRANNPKLAEGKPGRFFARDFVEGQEDHHTEKKEKTEGHLHEGGNPHVQGDPYRIRTLAGQLARRMIDIDASDAKTYGKNAKAFIKQLGALIKSLEAKAAPLRGVNILAQHEHSVYLLNWLKIETAAIVEPHVGVPPGPADLAQLIDVVPTSGAKFAVHAAYEDPKPSKYVTDRTTIPLINLPFTVGGTPDATNYIDFYTSSVQRLLDGLAGRDRP
jgi:zinc/manganese transport system substrate-binding protein